MSFRIVLAYSGGLDTSIIVPWLRENYDNAEVICVAADVGQGEELTGLEARALRQGASALVVEDLRDAFVRESIWPTLRAGAIYARKYLLGTSMARPIIARSQAQLAMRVGASARAHGCTGKGNDQVRFELSYAAFAPELQVIAPWRHWDIRSREDAINYADARGIDVPVTKAKIYSRDRNLWHVSHEGGPLEDPGNEPPADVFQLTSAPEDAPDRVQYVDIGFDAGYPVTIDGEALSPVALIEVLNEIAGMHGVGRADIVEDRMVGMKSRGIYETPGGTLLYTAHRELEQIVLDRRTLALKDQVAQRYADIVYEGRWWSTEREALDALVDRTQERVTGNVRLKLYKGNAIVASRTTPYPLYDAGLASFGDDGHYDHADAAGFIRLFSLPTRAEAIQSAAYAASRAGAPQPSRTPQQELQPSLQPAQNGKHSTGAAAQSSTAAQRVVQRVHPVSV
ncbi:MAG TPA: argininosuccinate synthase [Longimicrobiales bacterium]|nr:argininosuccinate synthase [Longimicrobiales bacterium]